METEVRNFIKVWVVAIASASYSYCLSRILHIPKGIPRLLLILPVIYLFTVLPSSLSSFHLGGPTIFYLVWLGNFKLLLYSFDLGPLSTQTNCSFLHFVAFALLPIKVKDDHLRNKNNDNSNPIWIPPLAQSLKSQQKDAKSNGDQNGQQNQPNPCNETKRSSKVKLGRSVLFGVKLLAFAFVVQVYEYRQELPQYVLLVNYCCHLYLGVEVTLAVTAALARATLGLDLDPQFNEPYLATSLQDFWGRRWNLMVSNILRLTVYNPIRHFATPFAGRRCALGVGVLASFVVSGLMHEVIYFYFTHVRPTWEVTWFFVLQGVCTVGEIMAKEVVGQRLRLHRLISGPLTIVFLGMTGWWLFLPQLLRNGVDVKAIDEYPIMVRFLKEKVLHLRYP